MIPFVGFGQKGRRLRFFGKPGLVGFHLEEGSKLANSACPAVCLGRRCCACESGDRVSTKLVALAWDLDEEKWVACVASRIEFAKVSLECLKIGCTDAVLESGKGPDVIVQGWGESTLIVPVAEAIGSQRGDGKVPCLDEQVGMLVKRSRFSKAKGKSKEPAKV